MASKAPPARASLLRATLTLLAGGAFAQALPLLLGPLLTRLYTPQEFGIYHLFFAVVTNVAVVACGRYEFALPMAHDDEEAGALTALCMRLLLGATLLSAIGGAIWGYVIHAAWPMALPLAVLAAGAASLATLAATRVERFRVLAASRVVHHTGNALVQTGAGLVHTGVAGLIVGPVVSASAAAAMLYPKPGGVVWAVPRERLRDVARRYKEFPLLNTPHAFAGALQDTLALALIAALQGPAAAGFWGLTLRYLKAPAGLVGGAVAQALYPRLSNSPTAQEGRLVVLKVMGALGLVALVLVAVLWLWGPWLFEFAFGPAWRDAGDLARALALYIGVHFVASPLSVVTMAWRLQGWALRLAVAGQLMFVASLALGLYAGGLLVAGWCVSLAMAAYLGWFFWRLPRKGMEAAA